MAKQKKHTKMKKVMKEFEEGKLHSGSKKGPVVKNPKQAAAIGYSEQRKADGTAKKPKKKKKNKQVQLPTMIPPVMLPAHWRDCLLSCQCLGYDYS